MTQAEHDGYTMNRGLGLVSILAAATFMGTSGCFNRGATRVDLLGTELIAGESIGAIMTVCRMIAGFLFFVGLLFLTRKTSLFRQTRLTPAIVLGGLSVGVSFAFYLVSSLLTTIANSVFLIYTGPLFCTVLARIFRKESINMVQGLCLAAVAIGMFLTSGMVTINETGISMGTLFSDSTAEYPQKGLGDALGLLSGVFYGISMFMNGYRKDCDTTVRGVWNFLFATIGSGVVAAAMCVVWPLGEVTPSTTNYIFMLLLWFVCGPLGMGLLLVAGRNLAAVEYSTVAYWECVVSLIISVVVFHEALTLSTILGGLLIMVGGALPAIWRFRSDKL